MRMLFVVDLHYSLQQFDWLTTNAGDYDLVIIDGDLLDLGSALEFAVQIFARETMMAPWDCQSLGNAP